MYYLDSSIAPSTRQNYTYSFRAYQTFCEHYNLQTLPPTEHILTLFATYLATYTSHSNIKLHMSAIKHFATTQGHYTDFQTFRRLYLLLRGIKRTQGSSRSLPPRQPITPHTLQIIHNNLFKSSRRYEDKVMLWAALTTAFFGFLRVSEYTSTHKTKYDHTTTLLISDITLDGNLAHIRIKASKTDPFRQGITIRLAANDSFICPIAALKHLLQIHPTGSGPLFTYHSKKYLTRKDLNSLLLQTTNGAANMTSHSLRIGAASTAASMGCPKWLIKTMGRWTSDCYTTYIRVSKHTIINTSHILANCNTNITRYEPYIE